MTLAYGAPVVIVPGSRRAHIASHYRLGRGALPIPLSAFLRDGKAPLHWTSVCGQSGVVVLNRGPVADLAVCEECVAPTLALY